MNSVEKTLLLLGATVALNGCFSGELADQKSETPPGVPEIPGEDVPAINSLKDLSTFPIGVAVPAGDANNSIFNVAAAKVVVKQHFSQITAENIMKPSYLQPTQGNFYFDHADALVGFAEDNGITIHGHTLVWHQQSPQWMENCTTDCSDILEDHIAGVVGHYATRIGSWDVVNEAFFDDGSYRNTGNNGSFWYQKLGKDYITKAFIAADAADSAAKLYYNDYNIEGNNDKLAAVLTMINELKTASAPIDGIGFQMHVTSDYPSIDNISASLKKAADTGLMVKITELDVRMNAANKYSTLTDQLAEIQKQRYKAIVEAYLTNVPTAQRGGISVWGVSDIDSWIVYLYGNADWPLLFNDKFEQKPALQGVAQALEADPDSPKKPEVPVVDYLFQDDFSDGVSWYQNSDTNNPNVENEMTHNTNDETMDIVATWSNKGDTVNIAIAFDELVDMSTIKSLTLKVKVPAAFVDEGMMIIQPYIQDAAYAGVYTGWLTSEKYTAGEFVTIEVPVVPADNSDVDFSQIKQIGLQIESQGDTSPVGEMTIQIAEVSIIE